MVEQRGSADRGGDVLPLRKVALYASISAVAKSSLYFQVAANPLVPVITLPTYDTESPRRTSYSMLPPCIERGRNLPNTISLKLTQPCTGMGHGPIVSAVWDPWPRRNMPR